MIDKGCYLIRNKTDGKFLIDYPTPMHHKSKCIFRDENTAKGILKNFIQPHWLLKDFEWEVVRLGDDWKSPNYGVEKEETQ